MVHNFQEAVDGTGLCPVLGNWPQPGPAAPPKVSALALWCLRVLSLTLLGVHKDPDELVLKQKCLL